MNEESVMIYGKHAVLTALEKKREIVSVLYIRSDRVDELSSDLLKGVKLETFTAGELPKGVSTDSVHQGYIAQIKASSFYTDIDKWLTEVDISADLSVVVLGEITDPHNVGAIIRSATAFGVGAVIMPSHRQAGVTSTVIKVSAGTAFSIPLIQVTNVNRTLKTLKQKGFFVYGLAGEGDTILSEEKFTKPSVFVVGNEGKGLRQKTAEACDFVLSIPISGRAESLNASVATAVVLNTWSTQHPDAL